MNRPPIALAARLTGEGRGAIAVVRVWGRDALAVADRAFVVAKGRSLAQTPAGRPRLGRIGAGLGDEAVAIVLPGDPPEVEIHGHGGTAASALVLAALEKHGARVVSAEDAIRRPGGPALEQEAEIALIAAPTIRVAEILLDQVQGALHRDLEALDRDLAGRRPEALSKLAALIARGEIGVRLRGGWRVVIAGRPNAGKSSLLNALAGFERAIVSPTAGTTRDVVTQRAAFDGWPVELADTAGLRAPADALEAAGIALARDRAREADRVVLVLDRSEPRTPEDDEVLADWPGALVVANKIDLPAAWEASGFLPVSAATGEGVAELVAAIARCLVPDPPPPEAGVPFDPAILGPLIEIRTYLETGDFDRARAKLAALLGPRGEGGEPWPAG